MEFGATVKYECDVGYNVVGYGEAKCTSQGVWSNPPPLCEMVTCPQLPQMQNGLITRTNGDFYQSDASLVCDLGFWNRGASHIKCQANGKWDGHFLPCVATTCPMLQRYIDYGMIQQNETSVGSIARIVCDEGYNLKHGNLSTLICNETGFWHCSDGSIYPNCSEDMSCNSVICPDPVVSGNHTIIEAPESPVYQSVIRYSCIEGYKLRGHHTRRCLSNQTWSGQESICEAVYCPDISHAASLSKGLIATYNSNTSINSLNPSAHVAWNAVARFQCELGYQINGSDQLVCTENSTWSGVIPSCVPIICDKPADIEHGYVQYTELGFLSNVSYQCEQGWDNLWRFWRGIARQSVLEKKNIFDALLCLHYSFISVDRMWWLALHVQQHADRTYMLWYIMISL